MLEADRTWLVSSLQVREGGTSALGCGSPGVELPQDAPVRTDVLSTLVDIENALKKFEYGQYGVCERCGKSLDWVLLEAKPEARLCIQCQRMSS